MCSGSTMPDCTTCRSCKTFGSALARQAARKSACFWLSPSGQIRSPGRITASSSAVAAPGATVFPSANLLPASRRSSRDCRSLCHLSIGVQLRCSVSSAPFTLCYDSRCQIDRGGERYGTQNGARDERCADHIGRYTEAQSKQHAEEPGRQRRRRTRPDPPQSVAEERPKG